MKHSTGLDTWCYQKQDGDVPLFKVNSSSTAVPSTDFKEYSAWSKAIDSGKLVPITKEQYEKCEVPEKSLNETAQQFKWGQQSSVEQGVLTNQQLEKALQQMEDAEQNIQQLPKEQQIKYWMTPQKDMVYTLAEDGIHVQVIWTLKPDKFEVCGKLDDIKDFPEISQQQAYDLLKEHNPDAVPNPANITLEDLGLTLEHKVAAKIQEKLDSLNKVVGQKEQWSNVVKNSEGNLIGNPEGLTVQSFLGGEDPYPHYYEYYHLGQKKDDILKIENSEDVGEWCNKYNCWKSSINEHTALSLQSGEHIYKRTKLPTDHQLTDEEIVGFYGKKKQ